jgi:chemotaxis protein methyltransferase CheR
MTEETAFIKIKDKIHSDRELDVNQYKENYLKRRLAVRMRALGSKGYEEYFNFLLANKDEMNVLLDKLTINVTQFFRDPEIFVEFENVILPDILKRGIKKISVWSAGCSSGEEPYSIAISIAETMEKMGVRNIEYEVDATDIDDAMLYRAVNGTYEGRTLDNIAGARKARYFTKNGNNYTVNDQIKKKVRFIKHNLMLPYEKECFDIVFCRNVIIYFTRELQAKVMQYYYDALKKDGILFLGKTETMLLEMRDRFQCINIKERIFMKISRDNTGA